MTTKNAAIRILKDTTCRNCNHLFTLPGTSPICSKGYPTFNDAEKHYCILWSKRNETDGWTLDEVMAREG